MYSAFTSRRSTAFWSSWPPPVVSNSSQTGQRMSSYRCTVTSAVGSPTVMVVPLTASFSGTSASVSYGSGSPYRCPHPATSAMPSTAMPTPATAVALLDAANRPPCLTRTFCLPSNQRDTRACSCRTHRYIARLRAPAVSRWAPGRQSTPAAARAATYPKVIAGPIVEPAPA